MKILYTTFFLCLLGSQLFAQDFTSKENHIGSWKNNGMWEGGIFPSNTGEAGDSIHIYGTVTLEDHLILDDSSELIVYDILWVRGNLDIQPRSSLEIKPGGVLIVDGILYIKEGSFNNEGLTVLIDHFEVYGGEFVNTGPFNELYAFNRDDNHVDFNYDIAYNTDGILGGTDFEINHTPLYNQIANGTLPIELLSFTATPHSSSVVLDWVTAWEENFDFFTVERAGSDLQFKAIGTVQGNGNTVAEVAYSFTDESPLQGQVFYRLKATDFDGSFEHHNIISVHFDGLAARINPTKVYPNPVTNHSLKVETSEASVSEVRLVDLSGRLMYTQKVEIGTNEIHLPESIKAGSYVLVLLHSQGKQHQEKIMVL